MPPVRDKRYAFPELFIDLFEVPMKVLSWSVDGLIFAMADTHFTVGQIFTGSLSFEKLEDGNGLFKAEITTASQRDGTAEASFIWLDRHARNVFARVAEMTRAGTEVELPIMALGMTWQTRNWSLSGLLLDHDGMRLQGKQRVVGMIRAEKADEPAIFTGGVIRADPVNRAVALKIVSMPSETFDVLEKIMKKGRPVPVF